MGKGLQIAVAAVTVFLGFTWLLSSLADGDGTFRYYESVGQYLTQAEAMAASGSGVRVHGYVVDGSVIRDLPAGHVDFELHDRAEGVMKVRYLGIDIPDLFGDGAEVVIEGRVGTDSFVAERIMAKCPSKYEPEKADASEA
jgi:cytochrome c-type biogenesis protein CcmE